VSRDSLRKVLISLNLISVREVSEGKRRLPLKAVRAPPIHMDIRDALISKERLTLT
jgi:hypothetical protein